jgi:hypothetical protein
MIKLYVSAILFVGFKSDQTASGFDVPYSDNVITAAGSDVLVAFTYSH